MASFVPLTITIVIVTVSADIPPLNPVLEKMYLHRNASIFTTFLKTLLNALINQFPENKLQEFCRAVAAPMLFSRYKYTNRLYDHFTALSKISNKEVKLQLIKYKEYLNKELQLRYKRIFLRAVDRAFKAKEIVQFIHYVQDLVDYGKGKLPSIRDKTHWLISHVIIDSIKGMSSYSQWVLENHLKEAINEYSRYGGPLDKIVLSNGKIINVPRISTFSIEGALPTPSDESSSSSDGW